jgi:Protein of unknown function (DUF3631)
MGIMSEELKEELRRKGERIAFSRNGSRPDGDGDLAGLLERARAFVVRYVVTGDHQADCLALWAAHTHAFDAADVTPYLHITSAEKRCGKTRLEEAESLLVARAWFTGRVTPAVLVRKIGKDQPTLLLDETDAAFGKGDKEYSEALRALLNSGYRRGGVASLCVKAGADFTLRDFPVFGAKMIAGIGKLPDTIADRCIRIDLKRRAPTEHVERWRFREAREAAAPIRDALEAWAASIIPVLAEARPDIPEQLDDRAAEVWEPLLAIADIAGADWPRRARATALALSVGDGREDDSLGVRLLRDIFTVFTEKAADKLPSWSLVEDLIEIDASPWGDLKGKELDARGLAWRLRPYGIKSKKLRFGNDTAWGYEKAFFMDACVRYAAYPQPDGTSGTRGTHGSPEYEQNTPDVPDVPDVPEHPGYAGGVEPCPGPCAGRTRDCYHCSYGDPQERAFG